jgi:uncharacterized protein (DUF2225 family)
MGIEEKLVRKRLEILLGDTEMAESYLRAHGPQIDMAKVAHFKEARQKTKGVSAKADVGNTDDPIFQVQVKCPICQTAGLECYELKAKSMSVALDRFNVPRYTPMGGFKPLNFNLYAVTVCPKCLFASPDKKDFITWSMQTRSDVKSQLGPFVIEEIKNRIEQRKALLPKGAQPATYFAHPRSVAVAVDSYRLAIHRAMVESTLDVPLSFYKMAMYQLKIALFMRDAGKDDEAIVREALPNMIKAFGRNDSTNPDFEYQLLQILVSMHIRLNDFEGAQSFLGVLERIKVEKLKAAAEDPSVKVGAVEKFVENTKALWTDRADPTLWKH